MMRMIALLIFVLAMALPASAQYTGYVIFPASLAQGRTIPLPVTDIGGGYLLASAELTPEQVAWALEMYALHKSRLGMVVFWVIDNSTKDVILRGGE